MISFMEDRFNEVVEESLNFFELGKYDDCIEMLSEAIAYARLLNRQSHLIKLMLKRADTYYHKCDYVRAVKQCSLVTYYHDQMDVEDLIDYHEIRAICLAQLGSYEEAIEDYQQLIAVPNPKAQFKAFAGLGLIYYHQARYRKEWEKYNTALFYYEKAMKQDGIDFRNVTMILHNMGMVYYEKGYYQKALVKYEEALRFHVDEYFPYTYNEMAKVYIRLEELDKASEYIDKAAVILSEGENQDNVEIARNFFVKALFYKAQKDYDTALFFFKLALNELKDREIIAEIADVYQEMASVYKSTEPDRAIDYLAESKLYYKMIK